MAMLRRGGARSELPANVTEEEEEFLVLGVRVAFSGRESGGRAVWLPVRLAPGTRPSFSDANVTVRRRIQEKLLPTYPFSLIFLHAFLFSGVVVLRKDHCSSLRAILLGFLSKSTRDSPCERANKGPIFSRLASATSSMLHAGTLRWKSCGVCSSVMPVCARIRSMESGDAGIAVFF